MKFHRCEKNRPNSPEKANERKKRARLDPNQELIRETNATLRWLIFFVCIVLVVLALAASGNSDQIAHLFGGLVQLVGCLPVP